MQEQQEDLGSIVQAAVAAALAQHEAEAHAVDLPEGMSVQDLIDQRMTPELVAEVLAVTLAEGNFMLPNGRTPHSLLEEHEFMEQKLGGLEAGQRELHEESGKVLDVLVGPVITDWAGDPDPDGRRDEDEGMMSTVARLDYHMSNGGVPVAIPTSLKAAIYTSSAVIIAALLSGAAAVAAQIIGG